MWVEIHRLFRKLFQFMYSHRMRALPSCLATSSLNGSVHHEFKAQNSIAGSSSRIYDTGLFADMWQDIQGANWWNGLLDPMNPVLKVEILRYGEFSQLCYDAFDSKLCMNFYGGCKYGPDKLFDSNCNVAGDRQAYNGYKVTKYLYTEADVILGRQIEQSVWIGFIAVCTDAEQIRRVGRRDILLSWRGTQTSEEWIQDITDFLVPARLSTTNGLNDKDVRVEKGFLSCYISTGETVRSEIIRLVDEYKDEPLSVTLTGHSLGAALATLSSYDVKQVLKVHSTARPIPVTVFAFASPRVGNRAFALRIEELGVKVLRLVNKNDLVPKIPGLLVNENSWVWLSKMLHWLPWTYFHVGVEIVLDNNDSPLLKHTHNLVNTHNLEVYLHLIDGYVGEGKAFRSSGRDLALVNKSCDLLIDDLGIPPHWWQQQHEDPIYKDAYD